MDGILRKKFEMSRLLSELRYYGVVLAFAPDPDTLLEVKAKMTVKREVRYPQGLEIYFEGRFPWLFDVVFLDSHQAMNWLSKNIY